MPLSQGGGTGRVVQGAGSGRREHDDTVAPAPPLHPISRHRVLQPVLVCVCWSVCVCVCVCVGLCVCVCVCLGLCVCVCVC